MEEDCCYFQRVVLVVELAQTVVNEDVSTVLQFPVCLVRYLYTMLRTAYYSFDEMLNPHTLKNLAPTLVTSSLSDSSRIANNKIC